MFGFSIKEIVSLVKPKKIAGNQNGLVLIKGISLDTRSLKSNEAFIALKGTNFDGHFFLQEAINKGASCLIVERIPPGLEKKISVPVLVVNDTIKTLGLLAKAKREKFSPFVYAVLGSQGKTTVKEMLAFLLKKDFSLLKNRKNENNHIGLPKALIGLKKSHKVCILELGTNHFGEIAYLSSLCKPNAAVITSIDNVHLEFFKNKTGVLREKSSLFKICPQAQPILNADNSYLLRLKTKRKPLYFGSSPKCRVYFKFKKRESNHFIFIINSKYLLKLNTLGFFNIYNALAALGCSLCMGASLKDSVARLSSFSFPDMRLKLQKVRGIKFLNDAYNSNPTALKEALKVLAFIKAERKIVVLADMLELGESSVYFHKKIASYIKRANLNFVIFLGKFTRGTSSLLIKKGFDKKRIFLAEDIHAAKRKLFSIAQKNDLVLLKGSRKFGLERIIKGDRDLF